MFTEKFVQILQERQLTAYKVAKETGISQGLMGEYKKGIKLPTLHNLIKIANYLNCSIDYLLDQTDNKVSEQMGSIEYNSAQTNDTMFWERFFNLCMKHNTKPLPTVKALSIAAGNITKWKNGTIPNGETLIKIADYFDCSVDYLLGRTDTPSSQTEPKEWNPTFDNYLKLDPFSKTRVDQYVEILLEENQIKNIKIVESDRGQVAAFGGGMGTPEKTESHLTEEDVRKLIEEYIDKD